MAYYSRQQYPRKSRSKRWLLLILPVLVTGGLIYWFGFGGHKAEAPDTSNTQTADTGTQSTEPAYEPIELQPVVDAWLAKNTSASYDIVVYDVQAKKNIAEHDSEDALFAASLYKIYIAYLALMDFQSGAQDPSEILIAGQTKAQCVDKMIRSSDSPCGEAMMADMGQARLNERVKELGMTGTFFNGIRTSAADSARILALIAEKKHLNDTNTASLLDSMLTQDALYKRGLASGAPDAKWETKVGWNENDNYHDIGIMTMPDGRKFVVAILSDGQGSSKPIANFAEAIYNALKR